MSALGDAGRGLPGFSIRRPLTAIVLNLMVVIAGLAALLAIEIRELPDVDRPFVAVFGTYAGAAPETVDAEATSVIEAAAARVAGVVSVRSASEEGSFRVRVEFSPAADLAAAAAELREAVSRAERELPSGVEDVSVVKADSDAEPVAQIAVGAEGLPIDVLTERIRAEIAPSLTAIEGVASVSVFGGRETVLRVRVDPARLDAYGLAIGDVVAALEGLDADMPSGSFSSGRQDVLVRADASVTNIDAIGALEIAAGGRAAPVRLGDVAALAYVPAPPTSVVRLDGREVALVGVVRQSGANTVAISDGVAGAVERLRTRFPDLRFTVVSDDAVFIRGAVHEVVVGIVLAGLVVVAVVGAFFGRLGPTLAPALAIPISLIGGVAALWAFGFSLNLVTLLALVLATGLVVDDAIVVLENIQRRRAEGMERRAAAVVGAGQVYFAVVATSITLAAVFLPISFLPSATGRLFREFGLVMAATIAISSFVALTLTPLIAARLADLGEGRPARRGAGARLGDLFEAILRVLLRAPAATAALGVVFALGAAALWSEIDHELTPTEDRGAIVARIDAPEGSGLDLADAQVERAEAAFAPLSAAGEALTVVSITGRWDPHRGEIRARLAPWDERVRSQAEIERDIERALRELPGARARLQRANSLGLRNADGGVDVAVIGADHAALAIAADALIETLEREVPELSNPRIGYEATQPQIALAIDRARAEDLGVDIAETGRLLRILVDGDEVAELTIGDRQVPVVLEADLARVRAPDDLAGVATRGAEGRLIPLSQILTATETGVAGQLDRVGQRRAVEISFARDAALPLGAAVERVRAVADASLPADAALVFQGEAAALGDSEREVLLTFAVALLVVFLVLAAQFESWLSAAIVLTTAPLGVAGAVVALWLTGVSFNLYSQIGVLLLVGVMAKNGILLVEFADQLRATGMPAPTAAAVAARARLRAIAMTLISTMLGALPLVFGDGPGAEARAAIGWVALAGVGLGALVTLFVTPAIYALVGGLSRPRASEAAALEAELARAGARQP